MEKGINLFCCNGPEKSTIDEKIKYMKKYGFYHTFSRSDEEDLTDTAIKRIQESGIEFDFLHLPFSKINSLYSNNEDTKLMMNLITDGIDKCAKHNIPIAILHLSSGKAPQYNDIGAENFDKIMTYSREHGVKIAFENLRTLGNLALTFEKYDDALFCWDVGHESSFTPGRQYMPLFEDRLGALHVHDNRGILDKDDHMLPYDGHIDFDRVAVQLSNAKYNGTLMLEVVKAKTSTYDNLTNEEFYAKASAVADRLIKAIELLSKA